MQLTAAEDIVADVVSAAAIAHGQEFPVSTWADVFTNTFSNLENIGSDFSNDPTPILSAIMQNQLDYSNEFATGFETSGTNLVNALQDLPEVLSKFTSDLTSGDVYAADQVISQFLTEAPLSVLRPLENAFFDVSQSITNNLDNVLRPGDVYTNFASDSLGQFNVPEWFTEIQQAMLLGPRAAEVAFAGVSQDIVDALQNNDDTLAFNDLLNAPSTILDGFLNGYNLGDDDGGGMTMLGTDVTDITSRVGAQGLLSEEGSVETIRRATETIAGDLGERAKEALNAVDASATADSSALFGDISTLLNPDTALGEIATAFDPNAVADITSLLSGDLAPNASGWVVDLFSGF
ncbi:MAG TPA: hypothetical protein VKI00_04780 [Mycobacterium sp.]|uniref:hypothetical protein n=1 Tax=Mycobacterium sp. TaxID=1785 RepID=UPI002CD247A1|nr:hypothetical protein [Mycobacterium sp.]HME74982.1 hypothetical protein [Mycobacterium sp.]